jgi:hypothetical protein
LQFHLQSCNSIFNFAIPFAILQSIFNFAVHISWACAIL